MLRYLGLEDTGTSFGQKFVSSDNLGQNIWPKVKMQAKLYQGRKL